MGRYAGGLIGKQIGILGRSCRDPVVGAVWVVGDLLPVTVYPARISLSKN